MAMDAQFKPTLCTIRDILDSLVRMFLKKIEKKLTINSKSLLNGDRLSSPQRLSLGGIFYFPIKSYQY